LTRAAGGPAFGAAPGMVITLPQREHWQCLPASAAPAFNLWPQCAQEKRIDMARPSRD
jgi:hypothetical protein